MEIRAKRKSRCAYPPIGSYSTNQPAKEFPEIQSVDISGIQLRPDGARQPEAEANVLGRLRAILECRASPGDIENRV